MYVCRIHENPLGDEGIQTLVSRLLALHGTAVLDAPDMTVENERPGAYSGSNNDHALLNGNSTNQTPALKSLEIGACGMTTAGARAVARLIRANIGITYLSLTGNKEIEADGWAEIAGSLEHNSAITTLELHHNGLENTCTGLIADGLTRNTSVRTVDLEGNHIGFEGAEKIQKLLEVNTALETVHLRSGNQISESVLASVEQLTTEKRQSSSAA